MARSTGVQIRKGVHAAGDKPLSELRQPSGCQLKGDPGFMSLLHELRDLHLAKANGYGTDEEPLANYIAVSEAVGEPDEYSAVLRLLEKVTRSLNLIRAGRAAEVDEYLDIMACAGIAEALRRRRLHDFA